MDRQQMLQEIYDEIANKTLSFWCKYKEVDWDDMSNWNYATYWEHRIVTDTIYDFETQTHKIEEYIFDEKWQQNNDWTNKKEWTRVIIWHPISLSRVVSALWRDYEIWPWTVKWHIAIWDWINKKLICSRKLINEDWSDAMLEDQSDQTIYSLYNLIIWEK